MKFNLFGLGNKKELSTSENSGGNLDHLLGYSEPPNPDEDPGYAENRIKLQKLLSQRPEVSGWIEKLTNQYLTDEEFMQAVEESRLSLGQNNTQNREGAYTTISFHNTTGRRSLRLNIFENGLVYFSASI